MITNLFSIFDPSSSILSLSLNWLRASLGFLFLPWPYWTLKNRFSNLFNKILSSLFNEFVTLLGPTNKKITLIFISLFIFILFNNLLGLIPYVFTASRHATITLTLALPLWVSFILFGWLNITLHIFRHLVPQGTPGPLIPFMVCIESIRNFIRPGTLAIRLAANIIAGHLLLSLLGSTAPNTNFFVLNILLLTQILLLLLETAVAIIQSYVFAVLTTLYSSEVTYVHI